MTYYDRYHGETAEDTLPQAEHETRMRVVTGTDIVKRYYINICLLPLPALRPQA